MADCAAATFGRLLDALERDQRVNPAQRAQRYGRGGRGRLLRLAQ
jgi:hypothetical protein